MANARKLQTEIDRVLKKVDEGADFFDEIWAKVQSAETQNLKEKHEMDLKKEIKKLQRLRDQIKTWVASTEVKDKDALVEARKLIETKMETFKICEKETKTKTYSKEGLAREDKMDPEEEARLRTTSWLAEYVERFQQQVEEKDFDIEKLSAGKGKKQNKSQIEQLQKHIANHKYHITKIEGIIRLINNEVLEPDPVDALQEDIDYYLESYQEDEYIQVYDQDFFYESLGLDELELVNVDRLSQPVAPVKKGGDDTTETSSKESKELKNGKKAAASVIPMTIGRARSKAEKKADQEREESEALALAVAAAAASGNGSGVNASATTPSKMMVSSPQPPPAPTPIVASPPLLQAGASMAAILKRESEQQQQEKERQKQLQLQQEQLRQQQLQQQEQLRQQQQQQAAQEALQRQQQQEALRQKQQAQQQQAAAAAVAQKEAAAAAAQQVAAAQQLQQQQQQRVAEQNAQLQQQVKSGQQQISALDVLTTGLGGLGLGGSTDNRSKENPLTLGSAASVGGGSVNTNASGSNKNNSNLDITAGASYLSALNESFVAAPSPGDNERSRQYAPQNPYPTPMAYPATPSPIFDTSAVFEKLGTDCLFFIFYYAQGTYQQYLAARELKKQSWRFHKKYMTWFQRHEEPKITTDEYEQGTYVYFDYETGWCTRIKQDFRFEYSFLEDSLQ